MAPDPALLVGLGGIVALYVRGSRRAGLGSGAALRFVLAVVTLLIALGPAIELRAERSLPFHMLQHQLLTLVAAPLFATCGADQIVRRLVPRSAGGIGRVEGDPGVAIGLVLGAATLHLGVVLAWHVPAMYQGALATPALHHLEHLSMLGTAVLFWMAVVAAAADDRAVPGALAGLAMLAVGGAGMGLVLLGSPLPLYGWYGDSSLALDQQRLAGAIMKVSSLLAYAGAAAVLAARWLRSLQLDDTRRIELGAAGRHPS